MTRQHDRNDYVEVCAGTLRARIVRHVQVIFDAHTGLLGRPPDGEECATYLTAMLFDGLTDSRLLDAVGRWRKP